MTILLYFIVIPISLSRAGFGEKSNRLNNMAFCLRTLDILPELLLSVRPDIRSMLEI